MIRPIVTDTQFLSKLSVQAEIEDQYIAKDLYDTLQAHQDHCVGMAANMIGYPKRIIIFQDQNQLMVMFNPEIIQCSEPFDAEEGCLSLHGTRKTKRYKKIKVKYQNEMMQERMKTYLGWTAQIIQHEIDHCNGILI